MKGGMRNAAAASGAGGGSKHWGGVTARFRPEFLSLSSAYRYPRLCLTGKPLLQQRHTLRVPPKRRLPAAAFPCRAHGLQLAAPRAARGRHWHCSWLRG
jgi:hypothetical protein